MATVLTPDAQWIVVDDSGTAKLLVRATDGATLKFFSTPLVSDVPIEAGDGEPLG
jgi:hypothetical protein